MMARSSTTWEPGQTAPGGWRKPRAVEQRYAELFRDACTIDDWRKIVKKAVTQAKAGDKYARQWLGEYLIGKPAPALDISTTDAALIAAAIAALTEAGYDPARIFLNIVNMAHARPLAETTEQQTAAPEVTNDD